jgi:hypothetical protein
MVAMVAVVVATLALAAVKWLVDGEPHRRVKSSAPMAEPVPTGLPGPGTGALQQPLLPVLGAGARLPAAQPSVTARPTRVQPGEKARIDTRTFKQMAEAWEKESDDPDWSLNVRTFTGAIVETLDDGPDAQSTIRGVDAVSIRCRQSACRIDADQQDMVTLGRVLRSSADPRPHVAYETTADEAGARVTAYLGHDLEGPADEGQ